MLLDIEMPDTDGVEVATLMDKPIPFFISSTLADDNVRVVELIGLGALGRVSPESLLGDVSSALGRNNS
jgi:DNA-binding response OmpR family regulator